jgi:two-component system, NarL family, response regulator LiaR
MSAITSNKIRVFIVDDHPMVRSGLAAMIDAESDFERVGEAANGEEALRLVPPAAPDVVLMDLVMPKLDGIAATAILSRQLPAVRFMILTSLVEPGEVKRAMDAGAIGYLLKNASSQELVGLIRTAYSGRRALAPEVTDALINAAQQKPPGSDLTAREHELLTLMALGKNNQEIAQLLSIAVPTVKFHVTNILGKLHANNRTEAVLTALKHKLVPPA